MQVKRLFRRQCKSELRFPHDEGKSTKEIDLGFDPVFGYLVFGGQCLDTCPAPFEDPCPVHVVNSVIKKLTYSTASVGPPGDYWGLLETRSRILVMCAMPP